MACGGVNRFVEYVLIPVKGICNSGTSCTIGQRWTTSGSGARTGGKAEVEVKHFVIQHVPNSVLKRRETRTFGFSEQSVGFNKTHQHIHGAGSRVKRKIYTKCITFIERYI